MQLQRLVETGNTVVVIEHDMRAVVQADWVMDIGPGAGHEGGNPLQKVHRPYHWFVKAARHRLLPGSCHGTGKGQCRHSVNDDTVTLLVYPLNILPVIVTT